MPTFDIIKKCEVGDSYRVQRVMSDFDVKPEHANERFLGEIIFPEKWNIGAIVGPSGSGKTTIASQLFGELQIGRKYVEKSVVDDMPKSATMEQIEKMFYSVGFGSVPSWLKPYSVLSQGEKMRVDLARELLENNFIVFDEFTSVVDRQVASVTSMAIAKAVRKLNKQFVAVSCHYDILEWLEPDWVFDTKTMKMDFHHAHGQSAASLSPSVGVKNGKYLGDIII